MWPEWQPIDFRAMDRTNEIWITCDSKSFTNEGLEDDLAIIVDRLFYRLENQVMQSIR